MHTAQSHTVERTLPHRRNVHLADCPHHLQSLSLSTLFIAPHVEHVPQIHQIILWACTALETLYYLQTLLPAHIVSAYSASPVCLVSQPSVRTTPLFVIGVLAAVLGTYIRVDCFKALGELFTFDLTVLPTHKLVTKRFYAYVRHPAYTGSILLVAGLAFSHLSEGSWLTECGPLRKPGSAIVVWAAWWIWTLAVGLSRADAEDKQMRKLFQGEWDTYAANVPWWFFPGLI
ncbi:hypothetical protein HGRIS_006234 [Hohenbuehelia grisea]|uniref:Protein-S-isoprenylcysteine O-methyltransferase n=1 Tax=Hohenbuehelia grisea TaxID=104357 RepID=A0ABR3JZJ4_9AGAR